MFEELNERRKAVERNIAKGFGMDDADLNFEKSLEDELEKGRAKKQFNIGDTFTRHGVTYKCTGISSNTGRPTWSKVKDGEGSKQEQSEKKEEKKEEKLSFEEVKNAISEYFNLESVKEGTVEYDRDTHLFIKKKYNSATKRYEAIVENVNGRRASSKEDVEQVLRRYFDELKRQNKIKYNKDKGNKKQENKKEIKKEESVKLTKKDKEEIENKINKFKYKGSDGWTEDGNRLPYDFELGSLEDGAVNLYGYGKAYGDSKTITDEFTYNRGKQYTMWYRGQPSNYWYAEPKQQLANNLILWLKEKGVINEDNYKSFKVKMRIELD